VFLSLESGVTRGAAPRQGAERRRVHKHEKLSEDLRIERQRDHTQKRELWQQRTEIFQLKNELGAIKESVESGQDVPLSPLAPGESKVGALPDFIVIGAQKSGTGRFHSLLVRHPNVRRAAVKEVHYFDNPERFRNGIEWYRRCFPPPTRENGRTTITGESTPAYLLNPLVPERMAEAVPQARLIVLLRNPVDRAYSHYHHIVRNGGETRSFEEAMEEGMKQTPGEEDKASEREHRKNVVKQPRAYLSRGIYVDQLQRWSEFFSDEQMLVLKSEDFFEHESDTMKIVQGFLGLPDWKPDRKPHKRKYAYKPMDPATRRRLEDYFRPHNQRLYEHLGVDFGW